MASTTPPKHSEMKTAQQKEADAKNPPKADEDRTQDFSPDQGSRPAPVSPVADDPLTPAPIKVGEGADAKTQKQANTRSTGSQFDVDERDPHLHSDEHSDVVTNPAGSLFDHDVAPRQRERQTSSTTTVTHVGRPAGFEAVGERRLVRVKRASYVNNALFEAGAITYWPEGVEELGSNLEECDRQGRPVNKG